MENILKSPEYPWLEKLPEPIVAHIINRVGVHVRHALIENVTPAKEDIAMVGFYTNLVSTYNDQIKIQNTKEESQKEIILTDENDILLSQKKFFSLPDFLFDDNIAQKIIDELDGQKIQKIYDQSIKNLPHKNQNIIPTLHQNIEICGKLNVLLSSIDRYPKLLDSFLKSDLRNRYDPFLALYYIENRVTNWKTRLSLLKILLEFSETSEFDQILSPAIFHSISDIIEKRYANIPSSGFDRCQAGYVLVDETKEIFGEFFKEVEYITFGAWRESIYEQMNSCKTDTEKIALLEMIFSFLDEKQESEGDEDEVDVLAQYKKEIADLFNELLGQIFIKNFKLVEHSLGYIEKLIFFHRELTLSNTKSGITRQVLKNTLKKYLREHEDRYPALRKKLDYDKGMQIFLDNEKKEMNKKDAQ